MAVPSRLAVVGYLKRHIPNLEVSIDTSGSALANWRNMLTLAGCDAFVLLEDDILLTRDFTSKIETAIKANPHVLIQFHSRSKDDIAIGSRWRPGRTFCNNQCVYFPPTFAAALLSYSYTAKRFETDPTGIDLCAADFLALHKQKYWNHVPSLADHLPIQSIIDPRRAKTGLRRQARVFLDPELDGCPIQSP